MIVQKLTFMRHACFAWCAWTLVALGGIAVPGCGETGGRGEATSQSELEQFLSDNPEYAAPEEVRRDASTEDQTLGL